MGNVNRSPYVTAIHRDGVDDYDDMEAASSNASVASKRKHPLDEITALLDSGVELPPSEVNYT